MFLIESFTKRAAIMAFSGLARTVTAKEANEVSNASNGNLSSGASAAAPNVKEDNEVEAAGGNGLVVHKSSVVEIIDKENVQENEPEQEASARFIENGPASAARRDIQEMSSLIKNIAQVWLQK